MNIETKEFKKTSFSARAAIALFLALFAITLLTYASFLSRGFFADDRGFLGSASKGFSAARLGSWGDLFGYWGIWRGWFYRPVFLTYWGFMLLIFGENPLPFAIAGFALHACVITLLSSLVYRLSRNLTNAFACAVVFFLYPLKSEAVVWIASHSVLLAATFSLLSLHCYLTWRQNGAVSRFWLSLFFFWIGLCCKNEAICTLPAIFLLHLFTRDRLACFSSLRRGWKTLLAFVTVAAFYIYCEKQAAHYYATFGHIYVQGFEHLAPLRRVAIALRFIDSASLGFWPVAPLGLRSLSIVVLWAMVARDSWKRGNLFAFFAAWALFSALPVPLTSGYHAFFSRFYYVPALAFSCAAVFFAIYAWSVFSNRFVSEDKNRDHKNVEVAVLLILLSPLHLHLFSQIQTFYSDPLVAWTLMLVLLAIAVYLLARQALDKWLFCLIFMVCVGTQIEIYLTDGRWVVAAVTAATVLVAWKEKGVAAAALAALAVSVIWPFPMTAALVLISFGFFNVIRKSAKPSQDLEPSLGQSSPIVGRADTTL